MTFIHKNNIFRTILNNENVIYNYGNISLNLPKINKNKMKKLLKITFILLFVVIVTLIAAPYFLKDDIEKFIKDEINSSLNATFDYDDVDLSLFRDFPNLNVKITNIRLDGKDEFKNVRLAHIDLFDMSLNAKRLFLEKDLEIKKIGVDGADLNIKVLKNGKANYDIAKKDTAQVEKTAQKYTVKLKSYYIKNGNITYDDASLNMLMKIRKLQHTGQGVFTNDAYVLNTQSKMDTLDVRYDGIHYLNNTTTQANAKIFIEDDFTKYTVKDGDFVINELPLKTNLMIALKGDDTQMDITYETAESSLKKLLSLVPKAYMPDFNGVKANGTAGLKGFVKGIYNAKNYPAYGVDFSIKNGQIQYPDLPQSVQNINVTTHVKFPGGADLDATQIDMPKIHFSIAGNVADGFLKMTHPMTDPFINTAFKSQMDLAKIKKAVYLPNVKHLSGILDADVKLKGRSSAFEKQAYDKFDAAGYFNLKNMVFASDSLPYQVAVSEAKTQITPQALAVQSFKSKVGQSDFDIKGEVTNYISYFLKKDQTLKAHFDMHSKLINLNEFMGDDTSEQQTQSNDSLIRIPKNLDITFKANADKLIYKDMTLQNMKGQIDVKDQKAQLQTVLTKAFGGDMKLNGVYDTSEPQAKTAMNISMEKMAINQTAEKLSMFKTYAPVLQKINGRFFSNFNMNVALDKQMNPVLQTLDASGLFKTENIAVNGIDIVNKVANLLKINSLSNAKVDKIKAQFEVQKGKMNLKPFTFKINNMESGLQGSVGLDQKINFVWDLAVPRKMLGGKANQILENLVGKVNFLGLQAKLGDIIKMKFKITGDYNNPKIIPVIAGAEGQSAQEVVTEAVTQKVEETVDKAKEKAKAEAQKQADALMAQAQAQADKIKAEAKKAADKIRQEARKQADALIKKAGNDPFKKLAAEALSKKIIKEADNKAKKLETTADNKAQLILKNAQEKSDKLLEKFN